jgi:hypothetical protein
MMTVNRPLLLFEVSALKKPVTRKTRDFRPPERWGDRGLKMNFCRRAGMWIRFSNLLMCLAPEKRPPWLIV